MHSVDDSGRGRRRQARQPTSAARAAAATQSGGIAAVNHQRGTPRPIEVSPQRISSTTSIVNSVASARKTSAVIRPDSARSRRCRAALPPS